MMHHHRTLPTSIHAIGHKVFEERYGIDIKAAIQEFNEEYEA